MYDLSGSQLGRYHLTECIGTGGMGAVYCAHDPKLDRWVAIKVLSPNLTWDGQFLERFQRECRAVAALKHPNIVAVYDVGQSADGSLHYLVMELLSGQPLDRLIEESKGLPPAQVSSIVRQIAAALDHAHAHGKKHRDVKPSNIILGPDGHATLTDFGLVHSADGTRLSRSGHILGTPQYMSPEQADGRPVSTAADVYSLGVLAYELLTGQVPFEGDTAAQLVAHLTKEPPPLRGVNPALPVAAEAAVMRALDKVPGNRFESAGGFASTLAIGLKVLPSSTNVSALPETEGVAPPKGDIGGQSTGASKAGAQSGGDSYSLVSLVLIGLASAAVLLVLIRFLMGADAQVSEARALLEAVNATATHVAQLLSTEPAIESTQVAAIQATQTAIVRTLAGSDVSVDDDGTVEARPAITPVPRADETAAYRPTQSEAVLLLRPAGGEPVDSCAVLFEWAPIEKSPVADGAIEVRICAGSSCLPIRASVTLPLRATSYVWEPRKPEEIAGNPDVGGERGFYRWQVVVSGDTIRSEVRGFDWLADGCDYALGVAGSASEDDPYRLEPTTGSQPLDPSPTDPPPPPQPSQRGAYP